MSKCSIQTTTVDYLKDKKAIDDSRKVINYDLMTRYNKELTKRAFEKYGVGDGETKLFSLETQHIPVGKSGYRTVVRAKPNVRLFNILNEKINNSPEQLEDKREVKDITEFLNQGAIEMFYMDKTPYKASPDSSQVRALFGTTTPSYKIHTVDTVIDNMLAALSKSSKPIAQKYITKIKQVAHKTKATVRIVESWEMPSTAYMQYDPPTNEIIVSLENLEKDTSLRAIKSMLHEIIHSITVNAYNNPKTREEKQLKEYLDRAYLFYNNNATKKDLYGYSNIYEFIAEAYTNPQFQADLKNTDSKKLVLEGRNAWENFINLIRRLFGFAKFNGHKVVQAIVDLSRHENELASYFVNSEEKLQDVKDDIYTDLSTTKKKLEHSLDRILENIRNSISSHRSRHEKVKNEKYKEHIQGNIDVLEELEGDIMTYRMTNLSLAITTFTENMIRKLSVLESETDTLLEKIKEDTLDEPILGKVKEIHDSLLTYSLIDDIRDSLSAIKSDNDQTILTEKEINKIDDELKVATGKYAKLESSMRDLTKRAMAERINTLDLFPEVQKRHENRLAKEARDLGLPKSAQNEYVTDKMINRDAELIQEDVNTEANKLLNNPMFDIYAADKNFSSAINVSNPLVQVLNKMLMDVDNQRVESERKKDVEFRDVFNKLVKEKGTTNIAELYKNITYKDNDGKTYLKGDYSVELINLSLKVKEIRKKHNVKKNELLNLQAEEKAKNGTKTEKYRELELEKARLTRDKNKEVKALESKYFVKKKGKIASVVDKYKTDYSTLSTVEKETLDFLKGVTDESNKITFGNRSLALSKFIYPGVLMYELPKVTKSDSERFFEGDIKGIVKDKVDYLTKTRADEADYIHQNINLAGEKVRRLKIAYREYPGSGIVFENKDQSLDLMTIYRLEFKNTNRLKLRREVETEMQFLVDIARNSDIYIKSGSRSVKKSNTGKLGIKRDANNNVAEMMNNLLENKLYDIAEANKVQWGAVDMNKAVRFLNTTSAFLTLSLNIASGTANVVNANAQMFLETFLKGHFFKAKDIAKANKIYGEHMLDTLSDITNPINGSYVNQVLELYNVRGLYNLSNASFYQTTALKAGLDASNLQVLQDSGEHWIQSVVSMSILNNIKVKNSENKFIDKNGKVVEEAKAASLLDMTIKNEETGLVEVDPRVVYTTHNKAVRWNEGGKTQVDALIIKKIYDTVGNYRQTDQPEIMRHWYGKLMMLYRKYLVPMGQARLRGIETSTKTKEQLDELDQRRFSYAMQEYEEGTYTTLIRYLSTAIKDKQGEILSFNNWNDLTDYEKHNIKRSVIELIMTTAVLPITTALVGAAADGADDDYLFFVAYQLRRLETELSAYRNPSEAFKMLRSPIPSARLLETSASLLGSVFMPWTWDEEYKTGANKGRNKLAVKFYKQIPVVKEFQRKFQDLFEYQNSTFGIR